MTLLDTLDRAAGSPAWVRFDPGSRDAISVAELWRHAASAADWWSARTTVGEHVAMVLTATPECVAALLGAWRAGLIVASLPDPSRMATAEYASLVKDVTTSLDASWLLVRESQVAALSESAPSGLHVTNHAAIGGSAPRGRREHVGGFVQFTSGSTKSPAGVRLPMSSIAANVAAVIERMRGTRATPILCSWLPLSHDMGLFGGLLAPVAAAAETIDGTGTWLIETSSFARRPKVWLSTCSAARASITLASPSALEIATRVARTAKNLDLSGLETCAVGAEMISPATLTAFVDAYAPFGLGRTVMRPSYGLAENTVAVTVAEPSSPVRTIAAETTYDGPPTEVVGCGPAVTGTDVRVGPDGEIAIRGSSLFENYTGTRRPRFDEGWLLTGDRGLLVDGHLYPLGRADEMIVTRGFNLAPTDVEDAVKQVGAGAVKGVAAVADGTGGYAIVIESRGDAVFDDCASLIRATCVRHFSVAPSRIIAVRRQSLPRTASGKLRRNETRIRLMRGDLEIVAEKG